MVKLDVEMSGLKGQAVLSPNGKETAGVLVGRVEESSVRRKGQPGGLVVVLGRFKNGVKPAQMIASVNASVHAALFGKVDQIAGVVEDALHLIRLSVK